MVTGRAKLLADWILTSSEFYIPLSNKSNIRYGCRIAYIIGFESTTTTLCMDVFGIS